MNFAEELREALAAAKAHPVPEPVEVAMLEFSRAIDWIEVLNDHIDVYRKRWIDGMAEIERLRAELKALRGDE